MNEVSETDDDWWPSNLDWSMLGLFIVVSFSNLLVFGFAGLVVWWLLLFAAYRLGKALGR